MPTSKKSSTSNPNQSKTEIMNQMLNEISAMMNYALENGISINDKYAKLLFSIDHAVMDEADMSQEYKDAINLHNYLSVLIKPALPGSVLLLENQKLDKSPLSFMGSIKLVRRLMLTSIISLIIFCSVSLSSEVNEQTINQGIFSNSGQVLLYNLIFTLASAALGASFYGLYKANKYVTTATFKEYYISSYWIRFIMGLISGVVLAELIPVESIGDLQGFTKPLLAILGGFSANVVYKILNKLVEALEVAFNSYAEGQKQLTEAKNKLALDQLTVLNNQKLTEIKQLLASGEGADKVQKKIDDLMNS